MGGAGAAVAERQEVGTSAAVFGFLDWVLAGRAPSRYGSARNKAYASAQEPCLPAAARHPLHHPGQGRPGPQPRESRVRCEATLLVAAINEWL
jgi:hypothetical protein